MLYISYCCVLFYYGCGWPRSFCLFPPDGVHIIYNYGFHSLNYYPPLTAYIGYLHLPARASIRVVLLRWGIRFLSGIRIRCFDYSRVTRVRVLLTFCPTSLRSLRILASLRVTYCDPLLLAYPHLYSRAVLFLGL